MAFLDLIHLAEILPQFEELILDRLSMKDVINLAKVNVKMMDFIAKFAATVTKKYYDLTSRKVQFINEDAVVTRRYQNGGETMVDILDLHTFRTVKVNISMKENQTIVIKASVAGMEYEL